MSRIYNAALYMRLSQDDENAGESFSIDTQRMILQKYVQDNNINVFDEYVDDGWSGTNFNRPDFQRMIGDIKAGKINCVITKDLSRFGREHIMMDYYLEIMFPENNVRYIAVTDNEDTETGLSDFVPFKNLFNEWYAKDTSKKIRAAFKAKFDRGYYVNALPPFGYKKDPENKYKLIVDPETSWIVAKIFDLAYYGWGGERISKVLTEQKIGTPQWYKYKQYGRYADVFANAPPEKKYTWPGSSVQDILKNEVYIGNTIHFKERSISYKNRKAINQPQDKWYRLENTHEAIVSREVFDKVQEQRKMRPRPCRDGKVRLFSKMLICSDCGCILAYGCCNGREYYYCNNKRGGHSTCPSHYIRYEVIYQVVLSRLQYWIHQAQIDEEGLLQRLLNAGDQKQLIEKQRQEELLNKAEKRKQELDTLFVKLYEDYAAGHLTEYNFNLLSDKYQKEQQELAVTIAEMMKEKDNSAIKETDAEKWITQLHKYTELNELEFKILHETVEKIIISRRNKNDDGTYGQNIDIYYRFVGKID